MTPEQFNQWLQEMRNDGFAQTDEQCAKLLGITRRTLARYKLKGAGLTVSLACKNLIHKLGPYT